ncbi:hypothetical protein MIB92_14420 [Aestuariirhabdus sp. Z084]|uniref:hypothetical protein n=1 Tax=Aestuariirhabdus haliotis TaxID=2918751 RepID=UPI00201B3F7F|nr:hypothetical protein [Aestuariirhabdus haliotis]MCL6416852.1 hypothetical protein [Aestuariirhabdus haliotis]MCL6420872.1 hypothetical protein [Aestuariirhabdus haliotis]
MDTYSKSDTNKAPQNQIIKPLPDSQKARKLTSFSVTSDSLVATATLMVDPSHRLIKIWWGDEAENAQPQTIDLLKERLLAKTGSDANRLELQHAYAPSGLRKIILVQSLDVNGQTAWDNAVIDLMPRYRFILYPIKLEINNHLDGLFDIESELDIHMSIRHNNELLRDEQWQENFNTLNGITTGTIYPLFHTLENTQFSRELTLDDDPIEISLHLKELDSTLANIIEVILSGLSEFDGSTRVPYGFHPSVYTGPNEFRVPYEVTDGTLHVILSTEMKLLVPVNQPPLVMSPV